ncbi:xanthine phosphoribosyltransferase [Geosporobacter ferrireducens]|uniref:Xanthine phosphoribosyltransferase n=1 Tax=Geosporobacter ferrireducens TaxID=1424294 RepID=A0A1D8GJ62_9FIRM|nr:xanthine phosphoribosyltransferase [Geosporobacter ferrireducens]AOT70965.1 xanthine phosphoribosyltransferase [Geosporobacter ferrireducens]MTI53680.1 xanthine phosphoribosyltransferase [Geosporobacter ferrireducens]
MEALKQKIREEGQVLTETTLKVDSFLNHQVDVSFMTEIGREFQRRFADERITKVITIEASGILPAMATAQALGVPMVFAKKTKTVTQNDEVYVQQVKSFTKGTVYDIKVSKNFIQPEEHILIIDDFLAFGHAVLGLADMIKKSGAHLVGAGIVIEKGFQSGGKILRESGIRVESLAIIEKMSSTGILFKD